MSDCRQAVELKLPRPLGLTPIPTPGSSPGIAPALAPGLAPTPAPRLTAHCAHRFARPAQRRTFPWLAQMQRRAFRRSARLHRCLSPPEAAPPRRRLQAVDHLRRRHPRQRTRRRPAPRRSRHVRAWTATASRRRRQRTRPQQIGNPRRGRCGGSAQDVSRPATSVLTRDRLPPSRGGVYRRRMQRRRGRTADGAPLRPLAPVRQAQAG